MLPIQRIVFRGYTITPESPSSLQRMLESPEFRRALRGSSLIDQVTLRISRYFTIGNTPQVKTTPAEATIATIAAQIAGGDMPRLEALIKGADDVEAIPAKPRLRADFAAAETCRINGEARLTAFRTPRILI